jgi:hypothetical protein
VGRPGLTIIGSALAYALWFSGLRSLSPTDVTFLELQSPVVATLLGWLALDQRLTPAQVVGGLIVLAALVVAQSKKKQRKAVSVAPLVSVSGRNWFRCVSQCSEPPVPSVAEVTQEALSRGHQVTAVRRNPARLQAFAAEAEVRGGDAANAEDVAELRANLYASRPGGGDGFAYVLCGPSAGPVQATGRQAGSS